MRADSLAGRLLCACNVAYDIRDQGTVEGRPWYVLGADFAETPVACVGGDQRMHAALVGLSSDGLVLSFRGTLPGPTPESPRAIIEDWLQNFDADMVQFDGGDGSVHRGFLRSLDSIWNQVHAAVTTKLMSMKCPRLLVTGHSKGGAMAHLAAARFAATGEVASTKISVHAFGTPRLGNAAFVSAYRALVPAAYRFECRDEIAPYLPPSDEVCRLLAQVTCRADLLPRHDYELVGDLRFIDWDDKLVCDSGDLAQERVRRLKSQLRGLHLAEIVADHNIECRSNYMKAIWPSHACKLEINAA